MSGAFQKSHSPFATRYSLPFSARQESRPPDFLVSCPMSLVPFQVGAHVFRHQLSLGGQLVNPLNEVSPNVA